MCQMLFWWQRNTSEKERTGSGSSEERGRVLVRRDRDDDKQTIEKYRF